MSGHPIRGALLGAVLGLLLTVVAVAFVVVLGLGREGVLSMPGLVRVVSAPEGFTVETGAGLVVVPLVGAALGALAAAVRGADPTPESGARGATPGNDRA